MFTSALRSGPGLLIVYEPWSGEPEIRAPLHPTTPTPVELNNPVECAIAGPEVGGVEYQLSILLYTLYVEAC